MRVLGRVSAFVSVLMSVWAVVGVCVCAKMHTHKRLCLTSSHAPPALFPSINSKKKTTSI